MCLGDTYLSVGGLLRGARARIVGKEKRGADKLRSNVRGRPSLPASPKCLQVYLLRGSGYREIALGQQIGSTVDPPIEFGGLVACCAELAGGGRSLGGWARMFSG